jgi:hypothetical protein
MDALKKWLDTQMADRLVEPNSSLGKAASITASATWFR